METEEQLAYLREKACDEAQGYYFGRPLPANEFATLLERERSLLDAPSLDVHYDGVVPKNGSRKFLKNPQAS